MRQLLLLLAMFVSCVNTAMADERLISYDDVKAICHLVEPSDLQFSDSAFPFVVKKSSLKVRSERCGIKITVGIYDFKLDSMAKSKFQELIDANSAIGIDLRPTETNPDVYEWHSEGRKYAKIGIKGHLVLSIVSNVKPEYFSLMTMLADEKYDSL